jgi:hypothetical protein
MISREPFPNCRSGVIGLAIAGNLEKDGHLSPWQEAVGHEIGLSLDRHRADPVGALQYNPRPPHVLLRAVPRADQSFQPLPLARTKQDFDTSPHPARLAYPCANWNHSSAPIY